MDATRNIIRTALECLIGWSLQAALMFSVPGILAYQLSGNPQDQGMHSVTSQYVQWLVTQPKRTIDMNSWGGAVVMCSDPKTRPHSRAGENACLKAFEAFLAKPGSSY